MDNCTLNKLAKRDVGIPAKVISYASVCMEAKKKSLNRVTTNTNDLPFFSSFIGKVSHEGVIHSHWAFLRY